MCKTRTGVLAGVEVRKTWLVSEGCLRVLPACKKFVKKGQKGNSSSGALWGWGQQEPSPRGINVCPQQAVPWCGAAPEQFPVGRWMFVGICRHREAHCPGRKHARSHRQVEAILVLDNKQYCLKRWETLSEGSGRMRITV